MVTVLAIYHLPCWPFQAIYHVTCGKNLWNETFLDIYLTTFFGVRKFKKTFKLWWSSFFWNCSKLNLILENAKTNSENIFPFWDKRIWKCSYKVSLLRRKYLSSAFNGLTNSPKILHIIKRHFFQLKCLFREIFANIANLAKVLPFWFQQCFGPLTMSLVEGSSEMGVFCHLSKHVFRSP